MQCCFTTIFKTVKTLHFHYFQEMRFRKEDSNNSFFKQKRRLENDSPYKWKRQQRQATSQLRMYTACHSSYIRDHCKHCTHERLFPKQKCNKVCFFSKHRNCFLLKRSDRRPKRIIRATGCHFRIYG